MKQFKLVTIIAAVFTALVANAANYSVIQPLFGGTNGIAATATNTYSLGSNYVYSFYNTTHAGIQPVVKLGGAGTSAVTFKFSTSMNGIDWLTNTVSVAVTAAGTLQTSSILATNWSAVSAFRLESIENANANPVVSCNIYFNTKQ